MPGLLHAQFLYAGRPSARIRRIDVSRARQHPGVRAVITQDDLPLNRYGMSVKDRTLFAAGVVRFDAEIVAAVAAETPEAAAAALGSWRPRIFWRPGQSGAARCTRACHAGRA